eukprot:5893977-Prymnesium_polylepis.1
MAAGVAGGSGGRRPCSATAELVEQQRVAVDLRRQHPQRRRPIRGRAVGRAVATHPKLATNQREGCRGRAQGRKMLGVLGRRSREVVGGSEGCKKARRA